MKKTILLLFALTTFCNNAQLAVGSPAPNFNMTDIFGVTHNLYDYTSAGKSVVIKLSATWCGPCWSHHLAGHWSDLHYAYGPQASDEVVVLFFEVQANNTIDQLYGISTSSAQSGFTLGNWVEGTPYPIIDNASITSLYPTGGGIPRFYTICPNNTIASNSASTAAAVRSAIQSTSATGCNVTLSNNIINHAVLNTNNSFTCSNEGVPVSAILRNQGGNTITSANASIVSGGNVIATQDFTMNRARWTNQTLTFNPVTIPDPTLPTSVVINTINGQSPHYAPYVNKSFNVTVSDIATQFSNITIKINLDRYGSET